MLITLTQSEGVVKARCIAIAQFSTDLCWSPATTARWLRRGAYRGLHARDSDRSQRNMRETSGDRASYGKSDAFAGQQRRHGTVGSGFDARHAQELSAP
ncbi:MAG: hypothetical protein IIC60_05655 [Proteobacteria bacterium]|nr:hypothetical protein [Pseudomonadota bacterium]